MEDKTIASKLAGTEHSTNVVHTSVIDCEDYIGALKAAVSKEIDETTGFRILVFKDNSKIVITK